jgi:hypothetical protein
MSDAATRWVAPYWRARTPEGEESPYQAQVFVLNHGAIPAKVNGLFFDSQGSLLQSEELTAQPRQVVIFSSPLENLGWMRIVSDNPVTPWGETPGFTPPGEKQKLNMSFYRDEPLIRRLIKDAQMTLARLH